jgi:hypothetical protein
MDETPQICSHCGAMEWSQEYAYTSSTTKNYWVEADGSVNDEWSDDNNDHGQDDAEPEGDYYCTNCGTHNLEEIDDLREDQLAQLVSITPSERMEFLARIRENPNEPAPVHVDNCTKRSAEHCKACIRLDCKGRIGEEGVMIFGSPRR